jgi:hypothetical protein
MAALAAAALLAGAPTAADANLLVSESFSYADGALAGRNGGTGFNGAWSGTGSVAGGEATLASGNNSQRSLASAITPAAGQSLYFSTRVGADPSAAAFDFGGVNFRSGGQDRLFVGMPFQRNAYGFGVNGFSTQTSGVAASLTPSLLVARILFNSASNLTVDFFVDPVGALGTAQATYTGPMQLGRWDTLQIVNNNSPSRIDDIRVGTTLADVYTPAVQGVPEPSAQALAGLALAALAGLSRTGRRRAG